MQKGSILLGNPTSNGVRHFNLSMYSCSLEHQKCLPQNWCNQLGYHTFVSATSIISRKLMISTGCHCKLSNNWRTEADRSECTLLFSPTHHSADLCSLRRFYYQHWHVHWIKEWCKRKRDRISLSSYSANPIPLALEANPFCQR